MVNGQTRRREEEKHTRREKIIIKRRGRESLLVLASYFIELPIRTLSVSRIIQVFVPSREKRSMSISALL